MASKRRAFAVHTQVSTTSYEYPYEKNPQLRLHNGPVRTARTLTRILSEVRPERVLQSWCARSQCFSFEAPEVHGADVDPMGTATLCLRRFRFLGSRKRKTTRSTRASTS